MSYQEGSEQASSGHALSVLGDVDPAALQVLENNVDFMSLLYCHLSACPPHGPFAYYSAMTLVERARWRYRAAVEAANASDAQSRSLADNSQPNSVESRSSLETSSPHSGGLAIAADSAAGAPRLPGVFPTDSGGAAEVLAALTIPNVLALIDRRYDTRHLSSWPLLYVPAEIRAADVAQLIQRLETAPSERRL